MARDGSRADLAEIESILKQFDEVPPLHAISTDGTHLPTVSRIMSPAIRRNLTGKDMGKLIASHAPAGGQDDVNAVQNIQVAPSRILIVLMPPQQQADLCQWY